MARRRGRGVAGWLNRAHRRHQEQACNQNRRDGGRSVELRTHLECCKSFSFLYLNLTRLHSFFLTFSYAATSTTWIIGWVKSSDSNRSSAVRDLLVTRCLVDENKKEGARRSVSVL